MIELNSITENKTDRAAGPVVTITFFKCSGLQKIWMLQQMQLAKKPLSRQAGITFFKLLGSGDGNGFSIRPDFSTYTLLCCWQNLNYAKFFFSQSHLYRQFENHTVEQWTVYMQTIASHGRWDRREPFQVTALSSNHHTEVIGVITRATIAKSQLWRFRQQVPRVSAAVTEMPGLIFSKGIGELPLVQQATFSLWQSRKAMVNFAYKNKAHTHVINQTRTLEWYPEELFARFQPFDSAGSWSGKDPLQAFF